MKMYRADETPETCSGRELLRAGTDRGALPPLTMKSLSVRRLLLIAALAIAFAAPAAHAADPRPWLCRDKPVFSSDRSMTYEATAGKGRRWRLFFMQFTPNGPHDGFSIVASHALRTGTSIGHLPAGRYYAAALYQGAGGYWICPQGVRERKELQLGRITSLCFSEEGAGCPVNLTVKPDNATATP